jgi:seryl-tRNA synthetase
MFNTVLGLFTGTQKWVYIALVVCALGFAGMTKLSVELYADKAALQTTISDQNTTINKNNELIEAQAKEVKKITSNLAQCNADKQTQNALIEQNRIDMAAKEKEFNEAMAKKPKIVTNIKYVPTGDDECKDLQNIMDDYISTGVQQ